MQVKIENDFFFVKTPYDKRHLVSIVLNGVWSKKHGMYRFPKNIHSMRELIKHLPVLRNNTEFVDAGKRLRAALDRYLDMKRDQDCEGDSRLRPYQRVDIKYLKNIPSAGIFNEPRTGKTPTSIILMKELGTKRNLVIAPASLCLNWAKELERWYPEMSVCLITGTPKQREFLYSAFDKVSDTRVMIVSKDTLKSDYTKYQHTFGSKVFDTCFIDEAHYLRNHKTAQSEAIFAIRSDRKYALTGTPTVKHAADIWGILHFLYPKKFPSYWQFVERYFNMNENFMGHKEIGTEKEERKQELQELVGFISVQRKRNEVMKWLPPKQYITHYAEMDKKQLKLYNDMLNDFVARDEESDTIIDTANVLAQLMRLRQLCLDPRLVGLNAPSAKTDALLEWLDNNREPVVIMSMFTSYFDLIAPDIQKLGLRVGMIHGKMSNQEKDTNATLFQKGNMDVLLCNIISAGTGFTLDKAETIIFTDKAWNPSDNQQAEDRITPTIEERNHSHNVISLVTADSIDERIDKILQAKKSITDIINEGGREAIKLLLGKI